jgi:hypothetical protein
MTRLPFPRHSAPLALLAALGASLAWSAAQEAPNPLTPSRAEALDTIRADSLKGHLSFLASDLLEGRDTPSRGLDIAAEYIAAQFRRAGLEPAGDDGYFQTARWKVQAPDLGTFRLDLKLGDRSLAIAPDRISLARLQSFDLKDMAILKVNASDADALAALTLEQVEGKAVVVDLPEGDLNAMDRGLRDLVGKLAPLMPALLIALNRDSAIGTGVPTGRRPRARSAASGSAAPRWPR